MPDPRSAFQVWHQRLAWDVTWGKPYPDLQSTMEMLNDSARDPQYSKSLFVNSASCSQTPPGAYCSSPTTHKFADMATSQTRSVSCPIARHPPPELSLYQPTTLGWMAQCNMGPRCELTHVGWLLESTRIDRLFSSARWDVPLIWRYFRRRGTKCSMLALTMCPRNSKCANITRGKNPHASKLGGFKSPVEI